MNRKRISPLLVVGIVGVVLLTIFILSPGRAETNWETLAEGVEYIEFVIEDPPNHVHVARMARNNENVILDSMLGQGRISGGVETVSGMAERYDQSLTTWGGNFGNRSNALVAINGFYFGPNEEPPGVPWSGQLQNGWYSKRFWDSESVAGFVWKDDRTAFIGECIYHPDDKQYIDYETDYPEHYIQGINRERGQDEVVIYTPQYDRTTLTDNNGIEVVLQMDVPTTLALARNAPFGTVIEIRNNQGNTPIGFDQIVISASGTEQSIVRDNVHIGDRVAIAQKINNCTISPDYVWEGAFSGIGGGFHFLKNGVVNSFPGNDQAEVKDPRTAIAYNSEFIYFIVVDGRNPGVSEGMTIGMLGRFSEFILEATDGVSLDGGGSSTMWVDGRGVVNNPSDPCGQFLVYLPYISGSGVEPDAQTTTPESAEEADIVTGCERWVANGMMMVAIEGEEKSNTFSFGDPFQVSNSEYLRLGPGFNQNYLQWIPSGTSGSVLTHTLGIDGVKATGEEYWWYVDIGGEQGWIQESAVSPSLMSLTQEEAKFEKEPP